MANHVSSLVNVNGYFAIVVLAAAFNRSSREYYSKYYDDELRELVRARFAAEIERFDYAFEEQ